MITKKGQLTHTSKLYTQIPLKTDLLYLNAPQNRFISIVH